MKRIIYYHVYNVFQFSYSGDYEKTKEKSKETFSSHVYNLIIFFIIYPLWFIFDGNSYLKQYVGTDENQIKIYAIIIISSLILIGYTRLNFIKRLIDNLYTDDLINNSIKMYKNSPKILNYPYRFLFVFFNFLGLLIIFVIQVKIFQLLKNLFI
ncbi:hypothetical protein SAMN05443634_111127 [Chishuiella changwenlii]|uniref:Uncharacterized protein n=1 Tax=Chishuiella changwenlii TaxID=1434701 RepID=A0A1M7BSP5_9FLAO|nr:hypothetical protein GCM10010984_28560 [Chishuiella changwenlii]SHL57967.1 hypothetical protein SAMN05443634_111127 [Chishuiella changwenlii]